MTIRNVLPNEWQALQVLNNEVFVDNSAYDPDLVTDWAHSEAGEQYFKELVEDKDCLCLVAENEEGKLVGYIAAAPKPISYRKSKYLEIDNMGVIPAYRSQGVGTELIQACKAWAIERGYQKLIINSYAANAKAIRFYKKSGFSEIDISLEVDLR